MVYEVKKLNKVVILSDSTCDLTQDLLRSIHVSTIPLHVIFDGKSYDDGLDITTNQMYQMVDELGVLPTTSAVSPGEMIDFFESYVNQGYDIVYLGIGGGLSATLQSAHVASLEFPEDRIYLVDSQNLSSGTGLLVLKAASLRDQGLSAKQIKHELEQLVPKVRSQFAIETLEYLHRGGRCSGTARLFGTMLKLKPIIKVIDGKLQVGKKPIGKMTRALDVMLDEMLPLLNDINPDFVIVTHSIADEAATYAMTKLKEMNQFKEIYETHAGCVISTHCGKGTIGILYMMK
jgi:DegV family protein with EDD domain